MYWAPTIHHDSRHLLTTGYNSITSPDVSSSPLDPHHRTQSALYWIKKPYWVAEFEQIIFLFIFEVYIHSIPTLSPLLSPCIFCCYWDTSPMDYTFAMKHNIVSGSNQMNGKSLSFSFYFSIWAIWWYNIIIILINVWSFIIWER